MAQKHEVQGTSGGWLKTLPIIISALSIAFGVLQYLDKREIERVYRRQQISQNAADVVQQYLDVQVLSVRRQSPALSDDLALWSSEMARSLALQRLDIVSNDVLLETEGLVDAVRRTDEAALHDVEDHYIGLLLHSVRNEAAAADLPRGVDFGRCLRQRCYRRIRPANARASFD